MTGAPIRAGTGVPSAPAPVVNEGAAADAIREAEAALAQQHSRAAQVDLQVVSAVLNAHTARAKGVAELDRLQHEIETAVSSRTDLATAAGAREFQRFLLGKVRDIRTVVDAADLDATSKAALSAALASLYVSSTPEASEAETSAGQPDSPPPVTPSEESGRGSEVPPPDPVWPSPYDSADLPDVVGMPADPFGLPPGVPAQPAPLASPAVAAPPAESFGSWGGGMPAGLSGGMPSGLPMGGGLSPVPASALADLGAGSGLDAGDWQDRRPDRAAPDSIADDRVPEPSADEQSDPESTDQQPESTGEAARDTDPADVTAVALPDGDTVAAPTPELAAVITAAVGGAPIPDAFRQQGITLPPPGVPVSAPLEPARIVPGDIGVLADRYALALGRGKALLDNQIQPISTVTGAGFPGWQHPPVPRPVTTPDVPAPDRTPATAPS